MAFTSTVGDARETQNCTCAYIYVYTSNVRRSDLTGIFYVYCIITLLQRLLTVLQADVEYYHHLLLQQQCAIRSKTISDNIYYTHYYNMIRYCSVLQLFPFTGAKIRIYSIVISDLNERALIMFTALFTAERRFSLQTLYTRARNNIQYWITIYIMLYYRLKRCRLCVFSWHTGHSVQTKKLYIRPRCMC